MRILLVGIGKKSEYVGMCHFWSRIIIVFEISNMARTERNICKYRPKIWAILHFPKRNNWKILWRQHLRFLLVRILFSNFSAHYGIHGLGLHMAQKFRYHVTYGCQTMYAIMCWKIWKWFPTFSKCHILQSRKCSHCQILESKRKSFVWVRANPEISVEVKFYSKNYKFPHIQKFRLATKKKSESMCDPP